ncbi:MAG: hypothetical protein IPM18_09195 [Phycisphaerales bacterium]|nr:hypothetical protein [Phycisphaerales bacterium]
MPHSRRRINPKLHRPGNRRASDGSTPADGAEDCERIIPLQRLAPVEEFDRVQAALAGQGLVDRGPGAGQALGERPDRQAQLVRPGVDEPGEALVRGVL